MKTHFVALSLFLLTICTSPLKAQGNSWTSFSSPSQGPILAFADSPSGATLMAASGIGIFSTSDGGTTWTLAGNSGLASLEVDALLYVGSTLLAGTHNGVYTSKDNGATWTSTSSGIIKAYNSYLTVFKLVSSPSGIIYAATESGIYKSTNSGLNWTALSKIPNAGATTRTIAVDSAGVIYAGTTSGANGGSASAAGSIYISSDGGVTWRYSGIQDWSFRTMTIDSTGRIFAGSWRTPYTPGALYSSSDGGQTWKIILSNLSVNVVEVIGTTVWVGTRDAVLYKSTDGVNFQIVPSSSMAVFAIHQTSGNLLAGSDGLFTSADGGNTWLQNSTSFSLKQQISQLAFAPDGSLYARSMLFGILRSYDGGATWNWVNSGLSLEQNRSPNYDEIFTNQLGEMLTSRRNVLYRLIGNGSTWTASNLKPTNYVTAHVVMSTGEIIVSDYLACLYRSTDGGSTFTGCNNKVSSSAGIVFKLYNASNGTLYAAAEVGGVYASTDDGSTWTNLGLTAKGNTYDVVLTPAGELIACEASSSGIIFRYTGNNTWVRSDTGITVSDTIYHLTVTSTGQIVAIGNLGAYISPDGHTWTTMTGLPRLSRTYTEEIRPQFPASDANGYLYVGFSYEGLGIFRAGPL